MIAIVTGGAVVGGELMLTGCKTGAKSDAGFSASNISLLDEIGDTIIPVTGEVPGAKAAQIGEYMKVMITDCYTQAEQDDQYPQQIRFAFHRVASPYRHVAARYQRRSLCCWPREGA